MQENDYDASINKQVRFIVAHAGVRIFEAEGSGW
jgi:hypothetical protein